MAKERWILALSFGGGRPSFPALRLWSSWISGLQTLGLTPMVPWLSGLWPGTGNYTIGFPGSQVFGLSLNYTIGSPGPLAYGWQIVELFGLHKHMSQISLVNLLLYYLYTSIHRIHIYEYSQLGTWLSPGWKAEQGQLHKRAGPLSISHWLTRASERGIPHLSGVDRNSAVCSFFPNMPIFRENLSNSRSLPGPLFPFKHKWFYIEPVRQKQTNLNYLDTELK